LIDSPCLYLLAPHRPSPLLDVSHANSERVGFSQPYHWNSRFPFPLEAGCRAVQTVDRKQVVADTREQTAAHARPRSCRSPGVFLPMLFTFANRKPAPALHTDSLSSGANCIVAAFLPCRVLRGRFFTCKRYSTVILRSNAGSFSPVYVYLCTSPERILSAMKNAISFSTANLPRESHCHTRYRALNTVRRYATTGASRSACSSPNTTPRHASSSSSPAAAQRQNAGDVSGGTCEPQRGCTIRCERVRFTHSYIHERRYIACMLRRCDMYRC
jgi:hypothetical protein